MAVQIPFPLPAAGFALNSKVRVNLDFIVSKFNEFNTGTATWDAVYIGTGGSINGSVTLYNSTNGFYTTIQSGIATTNQTYTWPVAKPISAGALISSSTGVMTWETSPTLSGLSVGVGGTVEGGLFNIRTSTRYYNAGGWVTSFINPVTTAADLAFSWPTTLGNANDVLKVDGSGNMSWGPASATAASKALDNLASVAINTSLVSDTTVTDDLGSATVLWNHVYSKYGWFGKDAVDGEVRVYAPTTLKGYISLVATDNTANNCVTTITNAAAGDNRTYTIPDAGTNTSFVMGAGNQAVGGLKTFTSALKTTLTSDQLILGTTNFTTISATAPIASRTYTIPDVLGNADFVLTAGTQSIGGLKTFSLDTTWASGKNLILTDDTTNTVTIALPTTVTTYTLTLPDNDGTSGDVLTTNGSGVTSWAPATGTGANVTLSNLSDPVAINKNLNNFSAGTITASLTGHASLDLPLTAGASYPLSGQLYFGGGYGIIFNTPLNGFKQIQAPNTAASYTLTIPATAGTTGQCLIDTDAAGTTGWATRVTPAMDNLASVAINTSLVSDTTNTDDLGTSDKTWRTGYFKTSLVLQESGVGTDAITIQAPTALTAGYTLTLPTSDGDANQVLTTDGSGVTSWTTPSGTGANVALSNLASVAINTSLVSDTDNTDSLGSVDIGWKQVFANIGTEDNPPYTFKSDGNSGMFAVGADILGFTTGGDERVRINSSAVTTTVSIHVPSGTALAPPITFAADQNTGLYNPIGDYLSFSTGGTARGRMGSTGEFEWDGKASFARAVTFASGLVGTPSITFAGDLDTGIYSHAADGLAITLGGAYKAVFSSSEIGMYLPFLVNPGAGMALNITAAGEVQQPLQPSFYAYNQTTDLNVTGEDTSVTVEFNTEVFDQGSNFNTTTDTFTAPVTGKYLFEIQVGLGGLVSGTHTYINLVLITSNRTYYNYRPVGSYSNNWPNTSMLVDMDASDTAYVQVTVGGGVTKVVDIMGEDDTRQPTFFQGSLIN